MKEVSSKLIAIVIPWQLCKFGSEIISIQSTSRFNDFFMCQSISRISTGYRFINLPEIRLLQHRTFTTCRWCVNDSLFIFFSLPLLDHFDWKQIIRNKWAAPIQYGNIKILIDEKSKTIFISQYSECAFVSVSKWHTHTIPFEFYWNSIDVN